MKKHGHIHPHAHTPPALSEKGRKRWHHYLWEFIMLFIAVFCGFLAENFREHLVERQREKQYMESLLMDLKKDNEELANNMKAGEKIILYRDSLITELNKRPLKGRENLLYHYFSGASMGIGFHYYDRTVYQLRSSGEFRIIRKQNVSDALLAYDLIMREASRYATSIESWSLAAPSLQKASVIFDIDIVFKGFNNIWWNQNNDIPSELKLITYNESEIQEFRNLERYVQITENQKLVYSHDAYYMNLNLESLIRSEYNIEY